MRLAACRAQKVRLQAQLNSMYQPAPRSGWLRHSWPKEAVMQVREGGTALSSARLKAYEILNRPCRLIIFLLSTAGQILQQQVRILVESSVESLTAGSSKTWEGGAAVLEILLARQLAEPARFSNEHRRPGNVLNGLIFCWSAAIGGPGLHRVGRRRLSNDHM